LNPHHAHALAPHRCCNPHGELIGASLHFPGIGSGRSRRSPR
jgi:hypothetical protein